MASALEEKLLDDPDLRGIKSLNRKFRNMGNPGQKSKVPKRDKPEQSEQQESEGPASNSEFAKLDAKYNNILKSSNAYISALFH